MKPVVVICGRPNVGKSTLFNRIIGKRMAIVDDVPGVTRDRNYAEASWHRRDFYLVDTGGLLPESTDAIPKAVAVQVEIALTEADVVLFMVDAKEGQTPVDIEIASKLRRGQKKVFLVVNKVDNAKDEVLIHDFHSLGLGEPYMVAAQTGRDVAELLDDVANSLPRVREVPVEEDVLRVAVLGRPNVGKSSLVNAILGQERLIVDKVPGTTRDAIDTPFTYQGRNLVLIDTAGLRKRTRVKEALEFYTTLRTMRAVERCQVAVVLLDGEEGFGIQDLRIATYAHEAYRGLVFAITKWDLIPPVERDRNKYLEGFQEKAPSFAYAPLVITSAVTKVGITELLDKVLQVYEAWSHTFSEEELNQVLNRAVDQNNPPAPKGKWIKFKGIQQTGSRPPSFRISATHADMIPANYRKYLISTIAERLGLPGVRLKVQFELLGRRKK
jgi:GTP-binding protein